MNVNPVATQGPTSSTQVATKATGQQVSASPSGRGGVRELPVALAAEQGSDVAKAVNDHHSQANDADRQKAEQLRAFIGDDNVRLSTYHDRDSGRSVLEVRDQTTGDIVSQYPSEELIRLYAALRQPFVDQSA